MSEADDKGIIKFARARLFTDALNLCQTPVMMDDDEGPWIIWEAPRPGHRYVLPVDIAEGKHKTDNVAGSADWSSGGVWRVTYDPETEMPKFVQCAQLRTRSIPVRELAQEMVAMSVLYGGGGYSGRKSVIIPEKNNLGYAFIEEAKDLGAVLYMQRPIGEVSESVAPTYGFTTTGGTKAVGAKHNLLSKYRMAWKLGHVHLMSLQTCKEMGTFANIKGRLEAVPPNHDDTVLEAALMVEGVEFSEGTLVPVPVSSKPKMLGQHEQGLGMMGMYQRTPEEESRERRRRRLAAVGVHLNEEDSVAGWL